MSSLPVDQVLPQLKEAFQRHSAVVLHAPPGAGKTTRVPLALLGMLPPESGRIIMLEPRRVAATNAARFMAGMLGEDVGQTVGYTIRFERAVSDRTRIEIVTEGVLTRRIQRDPGLEGVGMVIFDEFHERSIHADLSLALSLDVRKNLRPDLKILVMSATLDCGPVSALLGNAPVVRSEGRAYPVQEHYLAGFGEKRTAEAVSDAVKRALRDEEGDILAFLPGSGEIRACKGFLEGGLKNSGVSLHPLYGDLPFAEQERAIMPSRQRKVVLSTNIAETSLTIEGVRIVIDSGLTRRLRHDPGTGMNRLVTQTVSRASAEQRKGRAGRLGTGVCYRLYRKADLQAMVPFTLPEILVADLAGVVLELAAWGIKDTASLSWLDAPPAPSWNAARELLKDLGAIEPEGKITETGRRMLGFPVHPRLAKLLVRSADLGCPKLGADMAALLSERDIVKQKAAPHGRREPDLEERISMLRAWRSKKQTVDADSGALDIVERTARQLLRLLNPDAGRARLEHEEELIAELALSAYPDRIAQQRDRGAEKYLLSNGRGVRLRHGAASDMGPYLVALSADSGEGSEGVVHVACSVGEETIRRSCAHLIEARKSVVWDRKTGRISASAEERIGAIALSTRKLAPTDEEATPLLCDAIRTEPGLLGFSGDSLQFLSRVALLRRAFPEEDWPDMSRDAVLAKAERWLAPWLGGIRNSRDLARLDLRQALESSLTHQQKRLLDKRAPTHLEVPSGRRVAIDYAQGEVPVLAVKLQEMFGCADTPTVAEGRVKVLLHLLSPANRPVQVTQDLKGFWDSGYQQVKKELKGRYPKHPWPDDPWSARPTRKTKR